MSSVGLVFFILYCTTQKSLSQSCCPNKVRLLLQLYRPCFPTVIPQKLYSGCTELGSIADLLRYLHIQSNKLTQRMVHRIHRIPVAKIQHTTLRVVQPVYQCHVAVIRNRVILRAIVRFAYFFLQAFRACRTRFPSTLACVFLTQLPQLSAVRYFITYRFPVRLRVFRVCLPRRIEVKHPVCRCIVHRKRVDLRTD